METHFAMIQYFYKLNNINHATILLFYPFQINIFFYSFFVIFQIGYDHCEHEFFFGGYGDEDDDDED